MSYTAFSLIILLSAAAAVVFTRFIHRRVHVDLRRRHQDVGGMVFLQLGVLFAVLLAFVFSESFTEYQEAQRAIDLECGALHGAAMMQSVLPKAEARQMLTLEAGYLQAVVAYDWPEMRRHHRGSQLAVDAMTRLIQAAARLPLVDPTLSAVKGQILDLYATAHAQREVRLFEAQNGLPLILWIALISFGVILMGFVAFSGIEHTAWLIALGVTFAVCVSTTMAVVGLLNYPFDGALALKPTDFMDRLADVNALLRSLG
jgi:hypothetical protein